MEEKINALLTIIGNALKTEDFGEDKDIIISLYDVLNELHNSLPSKKELDIIEKNINDLEVKYDIFNELSYYFAPLEVKIRNELHKEEVKKIRKANKKRRKEKENGKF